MEPKARWRQRLARLMLSILLASLFGWLAAVYALVHVSLHPPRQALVGTPSAALYLPYENVSFPSTDGLLLKGWLVPHKRSRGVIILCHGYPGNRADLLPFTAFLHRAGFSVLSFDFRGLGESGGDTTTIGYEEVRDALGAVAYLQARPDTRRQPLGIFGVSMGGAVALQAAARSKAIRAVAADSPYASLDRAVAQRFRRYAGASGDIMGVPARWFGERILGTDTATVAPLRHVSQISPRPLLLIYGTEDTLVLPENSRLLFAAAGEPKQLWRIERAGHVGGYALRQAEYEKRVSRFFADALAVDALDKETRR